jgi:hypothetical protein
MHHTHVHGDLLLLHILFTRGNHKHEGTFLNHIICSDAYSQDTCNSLLTLSCYAFTCYYILSSHDCIHVGGADACYMFLQSFICYSPYHLLKALMHVVINYQKGGD